MSPMMVFTPLMGLMGTRSTPMMTDDTGMFFEATCCVCVCPRACVCTHMCDEVLTLVMTDNTGMFFAVTWCVCACVWGEVLAHGGDESTGYTQPHMRTHTNVCARTQALHMHTHTEHTHLAPSSWCRAQIQQASAAAQEVVLAVQLDELERGT